MRQTQRRTPAPLRLTARDAWASKESGLASRKEDERPLDMGHNGAATALRAMPPSILPARRAATMHRTPSPVGTEWMLNDASPMVTERNDGDDEPSSRSRHEPACEGSSGAPRGGDARAERRYRAVQQRGRRHARSDLQMRASTDANARRMMTGRWVVSAADSPCASRMPPTRLLQSSADRQRNPTSRRAPDREIVAHAITRSSG